jgi:hypothetical protein
MSGAERSDLDVEIDREWLVAASSEDPAIAEIHFRRAAELRRKRAERALSFGGLADERAALPASGGIAVAGQLQEA